MYGGRVNSILEGTEVERAWSILGTERRQESGTGK